jgi:cytochrome b subunit of formate dehydrogenase
MTQYRKKIDVNPFNSITSIIILVLFFMALYFIAKSVFTILAWIAPVLLIGALIIDYKVVLNYGKWIVNLLKKNILMGIGAGLLTFFGFPVIAGFLFVKALLSKKVNSMKQEVERRQQGEFVDYEELDSTPIELPKIEEKPRPKQKLPRDDNYDQFFE